MPLAAKNAPNDSFSDADADDFIASPAAQKSKSKLLTGPVDFGGDENTPEGIQDGTGARSKDASEMYQKVCSSQRHGS